MRVTALTRALTAALLLIALAALTHTAAPEPLDPLASILQADDTPDLPPVIAEQQQQTTPAPEPVSAVIPAADSSAVPSQASLASQLRTPVPRVTAAEFEALVHGDLPVLVEFMAPWCHYCKQMAPLYEEAAVQMKSQPIPTQLVIVDCMIERALCARFHVGGFPTIRLIRKAEAPASGLVVFPFEHSRTTLSFLVFCSTMWRTMQGKPFPELDATQAQWMKEAWAAQQATQANTQQQLPDSDRHSQHRSQPSQQRSHHSSHGPAVDNPDRPLGGMPGTPSLDTLAALGKINLGTVAARHAADAVAAANANAAGTVGGGGGAQKPGSIQQGLSASAVRGGGGFFSSWAFVLLLSVAAFAALSLLCVRFGPLLRSKASRHHSLQLSKNY